MNSYRGKLIDASFAKGRLSCELQVHRDQLVILAQRPSSAAISDGRTRPDAPAKPRTIALDFLSLRRGGSRDRLIYLSASDASMPKGVSAYTSEQAILDDSFLAAHPHTQPQVRRLKRAKVKQRSFTVAGFLILLALPILFFSNMSLLSKLAASAVPVELEQTLAEQAIDGLLAEYSVLADTGAKAKADAKNEETAEKPADERTDSARLKADQALRAFVEPLITSVKTQSDSPYHYRVLVSSDSAINAFALPGGTIVINLGLIEKAESSEAVYGVLAHEIMHVEERHGVRNLISSAGTWLVIGAVFGDVSGLAGTLVGLAPLLLNQSYSRAFESAADRGAVDLLEVSDIDPAGLKNFFELLLAEHSQAPEDDQGEDTPQDSDDSQAEEKGSSEPADASKDSSDELPDFFSTHPATSKRIAAIDKMLDDRKPRQHPYRDVGPLFNALKEALDSSNAP